MTDPHLDDEQLSLLLDGLDVDGRAHVDADAGGAPCATCRRRLAALRAARAAVAGALVPPLPADVLDRLVTAALDAPPVSAADVVPLSSRRRRLTTPPPAWLIGAAAGIAVLVGVAGVFRAVDLSGSGDGDDAGLAITAADEESAPTDGDVAGRELPAAGSAAVGGSAASDPEDVIGDLADVDDPAERALALDGLMPTPTADPLSTTQDFAAREATPTAGRTSGATADSTTENDASAAASPAPPATTIAVARAQCRAQADAIGAGRFAALLSTATLRWRGTPAEVLVFRLAEPSSPDAAPETRQALVLSRPGCELLADPRF
ncbi:MAG TPA: hypothetical protein VM933_01445 [Acidimicrobiales bacterium]|nr:hypothetical protein [Acidimicrobiales bacterium]